MRKNIALIAGIIILLLVNWSIAGKEQHLASGDIVYLELAPVDPRSLMQGDYMALRFSLANELSRRLPKIETEKYRRHNLASTDGRVVIELDEKKVAHFLRLDDETPLQPGQLRLRYRVREGKLKFASNAFFFQEGTSSDYRTARYGQFRADKKGELLLISLYDKDLKKLGS